MESFPQCAIQMLREFRAVLRISPIPITQMRLLQLVALNMFAIESTQLKGEWFVGWFDVGEIDGWRGGWFYSSDLLIVMFGGSCPPLDIITVNRILEGAKQRDCLMIQISNGSLLGIGEILKDKTNGYGPRGYLWICISQDQWKRRRNSWTWID